MKNRGEIYFDLFGKSKAVFKDNDFTGNKDEELCTYAIEGEKKLYLNGQGTPSRISRRSQEEAKPAAEGIVQGTIKQNRPIQGGSWDSNIMWTAEPL